MPRDPRRVAQEDDRLHLGEIYRNFHGVLRVGFGIEQLTNIVQNIPWDLLASRLPVQRRGYEIRRKAQPCPAFSAGLG